MLHSLVQAGVYLVMAVSVLAAFGAVSLPNIFHAALALIVTLLGVAGMFIALGAEFLAVVQILLYVGAVMTLVIFSIMMTERFGDKTIRAKNNLTFVSLTAVAAFVAILIRTFLHTSWPQKISRVAPVTVSEIGKSLVTQYAFPFEVISIFLIAALVGAIVIAKKDKT